MPIKGGREEEKGRKEGRGKHLADSRMLKVEWQM